ncbi:host-nuclease inhibitor Gam family protein [Pseudobacillus badius]|uniref:host-nuclease inhibitor Gam family protein n=1 Tax=Bacillus badius TaxID=1455 RepID=UPI0007B34159|nr:host-nuclease inhibitor Gam family protein [Bacillus badius]KZR57926.1 hypothetical protein A3781_19305 [Bacillus badius]
MPDNHELASDIYGSVTNEEFIEINNEESGLKITSIEDATRYAYGLSETRESIKKYEEIAQAEISKWQSKINQVSGWLEEVTSPLKKKAEYLASQLQLYHITEFNNAENEKEQKKLNTIKLPYGVTLTSRAQPAKFNIVDEGAYKAYATENDLLKTKEPEVDWSSMKKNIVVNSEGKALNKETGEFLPFIKAIPQERKFEVK